jgi:pyruvate/2-oxoglutarate dehydrogenase complex dihydrolipoamide dehydrogenase (E3) component
MEEAVAAPEEYDVLVLGSGAGGKLLAWQMAKSGRRTAVVERRWIGGSCPNIACMPSKNEIWNARAVHLARQAATLGAKVQIVSADMAAVRQRKQAMVDEQVAGHLENYKSSGAELILASGKFVAPKTLEARLNDGGTRLLRGAQIFINVGTRAAVPNIPGLAEARPLTHIEALDLDYLPKHLIVLGGGYVGVELAQAFRRFGSRVTVIEHGRQLMGREDTDVAAEILRLLSEEGVSFRLGVTILRAERSKDKVTLAVRSGSIDHTIEGTEILLAAGRIPNTQDIGLELTGVELDDRGYIQVNERLETRAPDIWAIGECAGSPHFTHVSADDFRIIWTNLAGGRRSTHDRLIPYCMFTDPPLAHVGLSESEAALRGIAVRTAKIPLSAVLRSQAIGEKNGFMKVLVSETDDQILGFTMIGNEAGEVMGAVQTAMLARLPYQRLRDAVIAHLTMTEGLGFLLAEVPPQSSRKVSAKDVA